MLTKIKIGACYYGLHDGKCIEVKIVKVGVKFCTVKINSAAEVLKPMEWVKNSLYASRQEALATR